MDHFLAGVERRAFRMAQLATRDRDEALDIVQEAMFKLVQRYADRTESEWGPLFYRILQNRIQDWHRRTWVRHKWHAWMSSDTGPVDSPHEDPMAMIPDPRLPDLSIEVAHKRAGAALETALQDLPLRQRQAFLLRAWEGFDVAETAQAMGCSTGSVKTHYSRAVHRLRDRLGDHYP